MGLRRASAGDLEELRRFLVQSDLTIAGLGAPEVQVWSERNDRGEIIGCTGFELSADRSHALIRSVAVAPLGRGSGIGTRLAQFALLQARLAGASRAWLFSRRSGPFWESLGFVSADRGDLAEALGETHQVRLFTSTGQLGRETAWTRPLGGGTP